MKKKGFTNIRIRLLIILCKITFMSNNAVFWDVAPCRSCLNRRFGGTCRIHLQDRKIRERGTRVSRWLQVEGRKVNVFIPIKGASDNTILESNET
jgi:hypothetical protein